MGILLNGAVLADSVVFNGVVYGGARFNGVNVLVPVTDTVITWDPADRIIESGGAVRYRAPFVVTSTPDAGSLAHHTYRRCARAGLRLRRATSPALPSNRALVQVNGLDSDADFVAALASKLDRSRAIVPLFPFTHVLLDSLRCTHYFQNDAINYSSNGALQALWPASVTFTLTLPGYTP